MSSALGAIVVIVFVLAFVLSRRRRQGWLPFRRTRKAAPEAPAQIASAEVVAPDPASEVQPAETPADEAEAASSETLPAELLRLSHALSPLAENSAHPWELTGWPQFQAVVAVFDRPDVSLDTLRQYACGDNWPLACAAFTTLRHRPDGISLLAGILPQLAKPWTLYFVLGYIAGLEARPPLDAALVMAPHWWAENLVIPGLFRTHFEERDKLGDKPDFGSFLESRLLEDPGHIEALLLKIDHPFAGALLEQLRRWRQNRLDLPFLGSFGRFWSDGEDEALLSEPESWQEALGGAENAILKDPPRSIMASGEARVGKTAFLRLLARRLRKAGWRVFEASAAEVMAGQIYIGQIEGRVRQLVAELDAGKRVAWYVTDLLQLAESGTHRGQSASILDQILPAVAAGRLVILGETTPAGLSRLLQLRPSARSLLEVCRMDPMSEEEAALIAGKVLEMIRDRDGLGIESGILPTSLHLAQQYLGSGQLPGVLIKLLKRSARLALAARESELTTDGLLTTLSQITGLPRSILDDKQRIDLDAARRFFAGRVMGQEEAVGAVLDRIAMLKAGLVDPGRPVAVFLFAGPTGTGKTELAKTLAEFLFGTPERMARLDMSEFQSSETTAKILGRPGFHAATDSLAERIRKEPFSVVLLDEFEKAHSNVWDLFLQIFDDGRLSDANGRTVDFRHCFIILTSNLGATSHRSAGMGFVPDRSAYSQDQVLRAVGQTFRPEFVNRLDRIIVFRPLTRDMMRKILVKELADVLARRGLRRREWAVEWEASAIEFLLDRGFSPEMGARPLKRAIDQHLLAPLAVTLVEHRFPEGDQFLFVRSNGKALEVEFVDPDADAAALEALPEPATAAAISLPAMMLRPRGTGEERRALTASWSEIQGRFTTPEWTALKEVLQNETADPKIWSRPDRYAIFARLALIDRVEEAQRTAERLKQRLQSKGNGTPQAPRELIARLALQLHLVQQGIEDVRLDSPIDVLLSVEPALESQAEDSGQAAAWSGEVLAMYRRWAERRRMQLQDHAPGRGQGPMILQVSGFGAFRTLQPEAGLHLLEGPESDGGRRIVARVRTAPGLLEEPRAADAHQIFARRLSETGDPSTVVRRYRKGIAPLVRDARGGWRSGRIEVVLGGDFDLMAALQQ